MASAPIPLVVGLGEVLWDCFGAKRRPGGAPANVAFHARQLGMQGIVLSRVGQDKLGDALVNHLRSQRLDTSWLQRDPVHPTGTVTVDTTNPKDPRYTIHENVAWDHLEFDSATEQLMRQATAVCFGTLAQRSERTRATIHRCLEATRSACLLVYDVNIRQSWYDKQQIRQSLKISQLVKLNSDEVEVIAGLFDIPAADHVEFARQLIERYKLSLVCITRAENGCLLVSLDAAVDVPGRQVKVADTVGTGDAFTAALIAARLRHCPLDVTAHFANEVGSLVASRPGGMPKLGRELQRITDQYIGSFAL